MDAPRVGIISHTMVQQHHLRQVIEACGFQVSVVCLIDQLIGDIDRLKKNDSDATDIWLVDVDTFSLNQTTSALSFERWLFGLTQPVIFGEGSTYSEPEASFQSWVRQVKVKLLRASSNLTLQRNPKPSANIVWVLAASTGGPEAVKEFLDNIPANLGAAFVYAQHIEAGHYQALVKTIARSSHYSARIATHGDRIVANTVTVVPSHQQLDLLEDGILFIREESWRGEYRPSIDQVVAMVANCFGAQSGVIFFSGMGNDGMVGARLMAKRGGKVWVQSPDTCTSDSMPCAVKKTGCVTKIGSPKQLASYFKHYLKSEMTSGAL
jgi:chemosensory pili system protein ChpB (putative protein-glutamate methylesterase)